MAKRTKKTIPTPTPAPASASLAALVATQRAALEGITSKRTLATLAVKLAAQHGAPEQQALKRADVERGTVEAIRGYVADLAVRAQQTRKVHLSELGGWPVCWPDERKEKVKPAELLTTPITVDSGAVTCTRCKREADIPSPAETAALDQVELEADQQVKGKRKRKAAKKEEATARAKRQLALKANLTVRLKIKDLEVKGVVRPDGSMSVKGSNYTSPHEAANALAGELVSYRIDGFQAWRFQDEEGRWRMLRDHA